MDASLFTGTGSNGLVVTNNDLGSNGFYPDLIWIKSRNATYYNNLLDYPRGASVRLFSNLTDAESNNGCQSSFNTNGFTLNADAGGVNNSGTTYVAWQWNAGSGTTSSNTAGSITSTVDVNATAGFSIVKYTGNGTSGASVGHGLGVAPSFIITKSRNQSQNWNCYHVSIGASAGIYLNLTQGQGNTTAYWNGVTPTSSVFYLGNSGETNSSGNPIIAYCWAEVAGFSKFGSYIGNGNADGPFLYTGFKPKFVMYKKSTNGASGSWFMVDSTRNPSNTANLWLQANTSDAEQTDTAIDLNSNGFKIRTAGVGTNNSGDTYIYIAFAENPFKYANAR